VSEPVPAGCCVVIVDDDVSQRELVALLLRREGFRAETFANGLDALRYLKRGASPCLIVLDLMMPVMDGWEFRRHQCDDPTLAKIPVLILSGLGPERVADLGGAAFLKKPFDLDLLLQYVRRCCSDGSSGAA